MVFPKTVVNADTGTADLVGGDDWDDFITRYSKTIDTFPYKYTVYKSGSNTVCVDNETGLVGSTNTNSYTVIQFAIDTALGKPIFIKRGIYTLPTSLSCVDKDVCIIGERNAQGFGDANDSVLKKSHNGTLLNLNNTEGTYQKVKIKDIILDGNDETGTGILANSIRYNQPFLETVLIKNCNNGMKISSSWYTNFINLQIEECANYGLWLTNDGTPATLQKGCNTLYFYGGRITSSTVYNLFAEVVNDVGFFGTILENDRNFTNIIKASNPCTSLTLDKCSLEYTTNNNETVITDDGSNNKYVDCRFENSGNTNYTAIDFTANAASSSVSRCRFGCDSTKTITINITAGAGDISFIDNQRRRWIVPTAITFTDSATNTICIGNSFVADKLNTLQLTNYVDYKRQSAPSDPSADYARVYCKQIDSNNDGLFTKVKKNGGYVEVQIG